MIKRNGLQPPSSFNGPDSSQVTQSPIKRSNNRSCAEVAARRPHIITVPALQLHRNRGE